MTITKTIHPPSGATAMIAATQADITALGWYYIPVVMLSAALALGVGLVANNIQRRYPVFWLIAGKIPQRKGAEAVSESPPSNTTPPNDLDQTSKSMEHEKYCVIISSSDITVPDFLSLENEHTTVLEEIRELLSEHRNGKHEVTNEVV
jgi:CBS-domain-containing membrane protein